MRNYQFLSICIASILLTACGSGGGGGSSSPTTANGKLPQNYEVHDNLKQAVKDALKIKVDWEPASGYKSSEIIGDKTYNKGDFIYFSDFDLGYSERNYSQSENKSDSNKGKIKIYRQPYSVIITKNVADAQIAPNNTFIETNLGYWTAYLGHLTSKVPQTGVANYAGKSFYDKETGNFNLEVDFGNKLTSGKITKLSTGDITLEKSSIRSTRYSDMNGRTVNAMGFQGNAILANGKATYHYINLTKNGVAHKTDELKSSDYHFKYSGHFFGPNAEEVAGKIESISKKHTEYTDEIINFAGQRGEIKK